MLNSRPFLVTPWAIYIKPRLKVSYDTIWHFIEHGQDEQGRQRIQIIDDQDREYWVRLKGWKLWLFTKRAG